MTQELKFEKLAAPDYGFLKLSLEANQKVTVEASAMATMDTNIVMKTKMKGGLVAGLKRAVSGESLFLNEFTAENGPGELCLAPGPAGDIFHYKVKEGKGIFLQSGAYVASSPEVNLHTKWGGVGGFFGGTGLFLLKVDGTGDLFFNSYGAIIEIPVKDGYVVDTGYIAAFEDTLQYHVKTIGGLKTTLLGGEGFVCEFHGEGRLWIQTRQVPPFVRWINPFRRKKQRNN